MSSRLSSRMHIGFTDAATGAKADEGPDVSRPDFASYRMLLHYAVPLVLSNSAGVFLQFTDRMFLSWHGSESVAGAGTAGIITLCFVGFFTVTVAFTGVFTAQYLGSGRPRRLGPVVWQGWYISLAFGVACFALSFLGQPLFDWIGHGELVRAAEIDYYNAYMRGGIAFMLAGALMGFFIGRGDNRVVMLIQFGGILVNVVLDYAMIFGKLGFPAWGVAGAAWATVLSQVFVLLAGMALFWKREYRDQYRTWSGMTLELALCRRILRYGMPNGLRAIVELVMWSAFLALIGLLGDDELAASNVAFTINSLSWQPMIGIAMAVSMLVGKAQGADRPDLSRRAMRRGLVITQCWETAAAAAFVLFPDFFLRIFFRDLPPDQAENLMDLGRGLLWFVAAYCLLDGMNVVFAQGLVGAGDSWWISKVTIALSIAAGAALFLLAYARAGLYSYWLIATIYICVCGVAWIWRYRSRAWETMKVVETVVVETGG